MLGNFVYTDHEAIVVSLKDLLQGLSFIQWIMLRYLANMLSTIGKSRHMNKKSFEEPVDCFLTAISAKQRRREERYAQLAVMVLVTKFDSIF